MISQPISEPDEWEVGAWPCCDELTRREAQVLAMECAGYDHAEIAARLGIARSTVDKEASSARARILPPDAPNTRHRAVAWGWLHNECCLATAWTKTGLPLMRELKTG
jgi:hypothetical protein